MLIEAKNSLSILVKSFRQKHIFVKIFEGEILIRTIPKIPLQIFCEINLNSDVIVKSSKGSDDNFFGVDS